MLMEAHEEVMFTGGAVKWPNWHCRTNHNLSEEMLMQL